MAGCSRAERFLSRGRDGVEGMDLSALRRDVDLPHL